MTSKITDLTADTAPAAADVVAIVIDTGGTPITRKMTHDDLLFGANGTPSTQLHGDSAAVGTALDAARSDHKHAMSKVDIAQVWLNFNQDTPAITGSNNVDSVTDTSAGLFTVVITTNISADTYAVVNGFNDSANTADLGTEITTLAVGSFVVETRQANTLTDWDKNMFAVFGDA